MSLKLYVGGLPYATTSEDLARLFGRYGHLVAATVIADRMTGRSKGFGFVEMATEEEAQEAIRRFNGYSMNNRPLTVNEARPREPRPGGAGGYNGDRRGGGGGYGGGYGGGDRGDRY